jgi:hypothetical protein
MSKGSKNRTKNYNSFRNNYDSIEFFNAEKEVEKMIKKVRPKIIDEMQEAAKDGDFSENFPYH